MIIVPRGETKEFYEFMAVTARINGDTLVIDRRILPSRRVERYGAVRDKRRVERRHPAPVNWERGAVIVVNSD